MLPVSLDYSFLIDPSIFSNVYMYKSLTGDTMNHLSEVNFIGPVIGFPMSFVVVFCVYIR